MPNSKEKSFTKLWIDLGSVEKEERKGAISSRIEYIESSDPHHEKLGISINSFTWHKKQRDESSKPSSNSDISFSLSNFGSS